MCLVQLEFQLVPVVNFLSLSITLGIAAFSKFSHIEQLKISTVILLVALFLVKTFKYIFTFLVFPWNILICEI